MSSPRQASFWVAPVLALILVLGEGAQLPVCRTRNLSESRGCVDNGLQTLSPSEGVKPSTCQTNSGCEPFYGMQFAYLEDLDEVAKLGVEVIMTDLSHDGTPAEWRNFLDAAAARGLKVIPWLWPQGWTWNGTTWQVDAQARLFLQTVAGHPALFAVYALHEPYWNECEGCGYSTTTQQALYHALKAIANVPLYSEINGIAEWTARGPSTAFADGICDYCMTSFSPFRDGGVYDRDGLINHLTADLATAAERAPHSRIVWTMPAYAYPPSQIRMPSADEMRDLASIIYSTSVAGAWWYPWRFSDHYPDYLAKHPELYATVKSIYESDVREAKRPCCSTSLRSAFDYGPASVTVGSTVWFTSTSSTCCGPLTQAWAWGDGTAPALAANATHIYTAAGLYTVTLAITDTLGYSHANTIPRAVAVSPIPSPTASRTVTARPTLTTSPTVTASLTPEVVAVMYLPLLIRLKP